MTEMKYNLMNLMDMNPFKGENLHYDHLKKEEEQEYE